MEGPQFSTYAESMTYKNLGYSVIGMTNLPEAKLAREAELCYATVSMVTDFDCWHPEHDAVTVQDIIKVLTANAEKAKSWWRGSPGIFRASTSRVRSAPTARSTPPSSRRRKRATSGCSRSSTPWRGGCSDQAADSKAQAAIADRQAVMFAGGFGSQCPAPERSRARRHSPISTYSIGRN